MSDAMYVAATGMRAHQLEVDVISNNVANINTTGFRREAVSYSELTAGISVATSSADDVNIAVTRRFGGAGTLADVRRTTEAGALKETGDPLHVAIDGAGFLEVIREDGSLAYTRAGVLRILDDGQIATLEGMPLAAQLRLPASLAGLRIDSDGRVEANDGTDGTWREVGQIDVARFANPGALTPAGQGLYLPAPEAGEPMLGRFGEAGAGLIRQGYLEQSNVELGDEMVALMVAQRAFEMNSRVFQVADQMLAMTNALPKI
jgi:flagellar basal-body rod protein FlgG